MVKISVLYYAGLVLIQYIGLENNHTLVKVQQFFLSSVFLVAMLMFPHFVWTTYMFQAQIYSQLKYITYKCADCDEQGHNLCESL